MNSTIEISINDVDLIALVEKQLNIKGESTGKWVRFNCPFCKSTRKGSSNELKKYLLVTNFSESGGSFFVCKFCGKRGNALEWMKAARPQYSMLEHMDLLRKAKQRKAQAMPTTS